MKTPIGGAMIPYGRVLPDALSTPDGALYYKTTRDTLIPGSNDNTYNAGLYVFGFVQDSNSATFGDQVAQRWRQVVYTGVDADTLDGNDSSYFQPADPDLSALANIATTGIYVRTGDGVSATRSITAASTRVSVSNGSGGTASNITIDVSEPNLSINNIGGTLSIAKGGTGQISAPVAGSVIYAASSTAYGATAAGSTGHFLLSGGTGIPTWGNPALLTVGNASNAVNATNANQASFASQLTTPRTISLTGPVTGSVSFSGAADVAISTSLSGALSATNSWSGNQQFTSSGAVTSVNIAPLQPLGAPGSAAYLTFNRVSAYTLNMGLDTDNAFRIGGGSAGVGTTRLSVDVSGNLTATGNVTAFSDRRLKKNVKPIYSAVQKVQGLHGVMYERIDTNERGTGLIAQDVLAVLPEAVLTNDDGIMSVSYGNLVGLLVEAIKEQQKQIEELRARLD